MTDNLKTDHRNLSGEKEKCENFYRFFFTENRLGSKKTKRKQSNKRASNHRKNFWPK